jgi:DNA-nicking Smr family endonuclease
MGYFCLMICGEDTENEDRLLWEIVTRDVKPIKKDEKSCAFPRKKVVPPKKNKKHETAEQNTPPLAKAGQQGLPDIDRRTDEKLRRGQMKIDASVDLHGMGKAAAHEKLLEFIPSCYETGHRCLLIITGKGRTGERPGILKENVPLWLQERPLLQYILQIHPAQPKDGGGGALCVLLRRKRG